MHKALPAFSAWAGPRKPRLLIVGEAWGENEDMTHQPFVGTSGHELWRMLGEALPDAAPEAHSEASRAFYRLGNAWITTRRAWLESTGISFTNVFNLRPQGNNLETLCTTRKDLPHGTPDLPPLSRGLYLLPEYMPELQRLYQEIHLASPNCIIAAGNTACWALLRATNIGSIRGAVAHSNLISLRGLDDAQKMDRGTGVWKVLPTYHPAAVLRQWFWRPIVVADLIKGYREAASPDLIRPDRTILINPSLREVLQWTQETLGASPPLLAIDIETRWGQITCIGFARSRDNALVVPFVDPARPSGSYWPTAGEESNAWAAVRSLLQSPIPKLFQNGLYDLQYIIKMGFRPQAVQEDTMLLHHSLYPELRKGLGFLGSIYTNESSWKLMNRPKADTEKRDE